MLTTTGRERVVDAYELSPTQAGMLYHGLLGDGTGVDLEQIVCTVRGAFDEDAFLAAFEAVVARHPILRTRFRSDGDEGPVQEVLESVAIPIERLDLSSLPPAERSRSFDGALARDRVRGIDLGRAPALRLTVATLSPDEHRVLWTFHHALLDGRSFPIVLREVFAYYDATAEGRALDLPVPRPYREYIEYLRELDLGAAEAYWREYLAGFGAPTPLVVDHPANDEAPPALVQGVTERRLPRETTIRLREFAAGHGVTLNTLLQAAWAILLGRYTRETDIVFGTTRACRRSAFPDADEMVGLFINTLPLRVQVDPDAPLEQLLQQTRAVQVALRAHEHTPLVKVQSWSEVPRGLPLFESILVYDEHTLAEALRDLDPDGARLDFSYHGQTNYPLTLVAYGDDELLVRLENDRRRVADAPASRMLDQLVTLLTAMPEHAERPIHELPLLSAETRADVEAGARDVAVFAPDRCLHERFRDRALAAPDRVAIVCEGESLTYGELDRRANALAWRLRSLGVGPGVLVGIRTERSLGIAVGILGILKAGGAYLPLDPAYPKERVEFMLADSQVRVVVTEAAFADELAITGAELVLLDGDIEESAEEPVSGVTPDDLAYVIYTSGSTGKPKGALVTHYNVARLFDATDGWFGFGEEDVWTLFHSYAFDFSVWELWGALLYGGRLVVVPYWVSRSPEDFRELLLREQVTVLNQTPSAFRQLIQADQQSEPQRTALRYVVFGGEALDLQSLRPWIERHGDQQPQLVNMYGITETTVHVTYRPLSRRDLEAGLGSVIGVPIPDLRLLLLDPHGQPVPAGVPGEIYVGGAGVARGYLDRHELTAERFVRDPFGGPDARLYRSGDLARRHENGELEYLGRIDDQVKIRGFRIELGEIQAVLEQQPDVAEAVVLARTDTPGEQRLVAYVVADGDRGALVERLKSQLKAQLPDYMVPAHFVLLTALPITPNGKLDRKALPVPDPASEERERPYVAPRSPTEETLASIWAAVLRVPRVSVDDNFFDLGGDSILTIQVIARCRQAGLQFTPRDLFKRPTVAQLAEVIAPAEETTAEEPEADGVLTPTPIQRWFFEQRLAEPSHWNQAFLFELPADLDVDILGTALELVVERHAALRLRVVEGEPVALAIERAAPAPPIKRVELASVARDERAAAIESAAAAAQSELDLGRGRLVAAVHYDLGAAAHRLLLAVHHLAIDGVSWRILLEDLEAAYRALAADAPVQFPPATAPFARWARALQEHAAVVGRSLTAWREITSVPGDLPEQAHGGANTEALARTLTVSLDRAETEALLKQVPVAYRTQMNDALLAALALALREWSGRDAHRIEIEGHGREELTAPVDVSRTVGWFTSLYPVALDLSGADDEGAALKVVKETIRRVPDRGLSYGLLRYASAVPAVRAELAAAEPAELLFNYLGQFDQVVADSELFRFAPEPTGPWHGPANERTHRLEVVALVRDGRFEARWIYGAERDREDVIRRVADDFIGALRGLIAHCAQPGVAGSTPSDFPLAPLSQDGLDRLLARHAGLEDVYPLSPMQRLFLSLEAGSADIGFEQWVFRLTGPVDPDALRAAWADTVARHAALRTAFVADAGAEPLQVVQREVQLPWSEEDWRDAGEDEAQGRLESFLRSDRERGFDVGVAPLSRVTLVRLGDEEHRLVWSTHHLYVDGWSWPLVFRDVGAAYAAHLAGKKPELPRPAQYRAYIEWLADEAPDSRAFWQQRLAGFTSPTPLPGGNAESVDGGGSERSTRLDPAATQALERLARSAGVTLNTVTQAGWAILLGHVSDRDDVVFGAAFSGRPPELAGVETLVGPCVNNLPVRVRLDGARSVRDWLAELHERSLEATQHQYASPAEIQEWTGIPWRLRLFDSLLVFQNYLVDDAALGWGPVRVEQLVAPEATNYPLTLTVTPGTELTLRLLGLPGRFGEGALATMLDGLQDVLAALAERPDSSLAQIAAALPASTKGTATAPAAAAARPAYAAPANELERLVAEIWRELFGLEQVGTEDNFFDLGGHSILLLQAHTRLRERTRADLPVVALLQYPTIRSLARYLGGETSSDAPAAARDRAALQRQALARRRNLQGKR